MPTHPRRAPAALANFATTDRLEFRIETLRRFFRRELAFGLEVLGRDDVLGARVLEIGPGTGVHARALLRRTRAKPSLWLLVDRSEAMACAAARSLRRLAPAMAVVGDADRLPVAARARFDVIVAMHCLMFSRSPSRAIEALAARLAPGGRLVVTVPGDADSDGVTFVAPSPRSGAPRVERAGRTPRLG